ncbi:MAG: response regulator [Acidobacteria bacterium]|nr:response regulator [Acidobacteriota bacterium]
MTTDGVSRPGTRERYAGMKVLVVDDQADVRLPLSTVLRKHVGCSVFEATNGLEALHLLGRHPFHLVILDVLMPVMNGIEMLDALRRLPQCQHLGVVVLSAVRDEQKIRQLACHGIAAYLAKPQRPYDVAERVQHILDTLSVESFGTGTGTGDRGALDQALTAPPELRAQLVKATQQCLAMTFGFSLSAVEGMREAIRSDVARVVLRVPRGRSNFEIAIAAARPVSARMTAPYLHAGLAVTDADVAAALGTMVTAVARRLQSTLRERHEVVQLDQVVVTHDVEADNTPGGLHVSFTSDTGGVHVTARLCAVSHETPRETPEVRPTPVGGDREGAVQMESTSATVQPVDPLVLEMLASLQEDGEPDLLVELITLFLQETSARLADLAGEPTDAPSTARVAHSIKGSAGNLGASGLQALAARLETAAQEGQVGDTLRTLVADVDAEFRRVERHLRDVRASRLAA